MQFKAFTFGISQRFWMRHFYILLFSFLLFSKTTFSQGNRLVITSSVPTELTVCGEQQTFTLQLYNPSPNLLTNVSLSVTLPDGMRYTTGSISGGTEQNISNLSAPVFALNDIATLTNRTITFSASAGCDVMAYLAAGLPARNLARVNYTANGFNTFDGDTSFTYLIKQPNVSITTVTNQSYSGNVGDTYTRCITITNGGLGALSQFVFTDQHDNGIQINSINRGTRVTQGNTEIVTLGAADFATIGNGNGLFESGESITICENITVTNCVAVSSAFTAAWGCNNQVCQSSNSSANVVFPNLTPNLVVTHTPSQSACYGMATANQQKLAIHNTGLGQATNVSINVFNSTGTTFVAGMQTAMDANSFTYRINNGAAQPITPTVNGLSGNYVCLAGMRTGNVTLNLPPINAGDSIIVLWNTYSCCQDDCAGTGVGAGTSAGWSYQGSYSNICQNNYIIPRTYARSYDQLYSDFADNNSPATIANGQTLQFSFAFVNDANGFVSLSTRQWRYVVTLPNCMSYAGNARIVRANGINVWNPASVTTAGNTVTITFNGNPPFNRTNGDLRFDLTADCASCGGTGGVGTIRVESFFISDPNCACNHRVACINHPITVVCPTTCAGMNISNFTIARTNYGERDDNNDGVPEAGPVSLNLIRRDRAMFGDTVTAHFSGTVNGNYQYLFAQSAITNGNNYLTFIDGELTITRGGTTYTCASPAPTVTNAGNTRTFRYNLSAAGLIASGCVPAGFTFQTGDVVNFRPRYRVTRNTGGAVLLCRVTNEFFTSDIANPTLAANKFFCNNYDGAFSIVGYYYTNWGPNSFVVNSCNTVTLTNNYYLSIGPCCQQYAGGNMFPYEYRYWAHPQMLRVVPPTGYTFVSARFNHIRTAGSQVTNTSAWQALTPSNNSPDTLEFAVEQYFSRFGGAFQESDDGFFGTLEVTLQPTCRVVQNVASNVVYDWFFGESVNLIGTNTSNVSSRGDLDFITYQGPDLFVQSQLPSVLAQDATASWEVSISNTTAFAAENVFVAAPQISGVAVVEVFDVTNNAVVNPSAGGIYQLGQVAGNGIRNLCITASYTSCAPDSVILHAGWNCGNYPANLSTYPCTTDRIRLTLSPQIPTLIANVTSPSGTVDLCDTASYVVEGVNIQLGTAYDLKLRVILPPGVIITPGSSQLSYPPGAPFINIPNPTFISGTSYEWDLSVINATLGADGLKGILQTALNNVKVRFRVRTDCDYTSGSLIGFNFNGRSACGLYTGQEISLSSQLAVTGADKPYDAEVHLSSTYISPCVSSTPITVTVKNNGPLATTNLDSVVIVLPRHAAYVNGSFSGIHNTPPAASFKQYVLNNLQHIAWQLPDGIAAGDSIKFSVQFDVVADSLVCGIETIEAFTVSAKNLLCIQNNQSCGIKVRTGDTTLPIYVYKASLEFTALGAVAYPAGNNAERLEVNGSLYNFGETIAQGIGLVVKYYRDADGNNVFSGADVLLHTDTVLDEITSAAAYNFSASFNVNAGNGCNLIALIETNTNPCVCSATEIFSGNIPYLNAGNDSAICSGGVMPIGVVNVTGYQYTWTPATGVADAASGFTTFSANNFTASSVQQQLVLTTNRINCTTSDTLVATIHPKTFLTIANLQAEYCVNYAAQTLSLTPTGGTLSGNGISGNDFIPAVAGAGNHIISYAFTDANNCGWDTTESTIVHPLTPTNFSGLAPAYCVDAATVTLSENPAGGTFSGAGISGNNFSANAAGVGMHSIIYTFTDANNCTNADTQNVTVNALPVVSFTGLNANYCNYAGSVALQGTPAGGLFSGAGISGNDFTMNSAGVGVHEVVYEFTDGAGCYASDTQQTEVFALPTPFAGNDTAICLNQSAQLNATGGGSYLWSNGVANASQTVSPTNTTQFVVTVTDANNCMAADSVIVNVNALPQIMLAPTDVSCNGFDDGSITPTINSGTAPFTYAWSNAETSNAIQNLSPNVYALSVTDANGCADTADATITEPAALSSTEILNDSVSCFGRSDGSATLQISGGITPYAILWNSNPPQQTAALSNVVAGTYIANITDANGCVLAHTVLIEEPSLLTANIQNVLNLLCFENPQGSAEVVAQGSIPGYTYNWSSNPPQQTAVAQNLFAGSYDVTVTDFIGCTAIANITITQPTRLLLALVDSTQPSCFSESNGSIVVSASGGVTAYTYQWNFDNTLNSANAQNIAQGFYSVTVIDNNNCRDSLALNLPEPNLLTVSIAHSNLSCYLSNDGTLNTSVNGGNGGYGYQWNNAGVFGSEGSNLAAGNYAVTVTDALGCTTTDATQILQPDEIIISMLQDTTVRLGHPVLLRNKVVGGVGAYTFDWQPTKNLSCSNCESPVSSTLENMEYDLLVTDATGCTAAGSVRIFVLLDKQLYIPNLFTPNGDGSNDMFGIFTDDLSVKQFSLKIFNRWGEKVFETNNHLQGWDGFYNGETAPAGNYIYDTFITYVDGKTEKRKGSVMLIR